MDKGILLCGLALLAGCAAAPAQRMVTCADAPSVAIETSADGRTASILLDVLTYNIEGLPWPARTGRGPYLQEIGERLAAFRAEGKSPDIIVFQEVFSRAATRAVESTNYRSLVAGPSRRSRQALQTPACGSPRLPKPNRHLQRAALTSRVAPSAG